VIDRSEGSIRHRTFRDILEYLKPGDVLVVNDTRVSAFRLYGRKKTGAFVEALVVDRRPEGLWQALMKPGRRLHRGDQVIFEGGLTGTVVERLDDGSRLLDFSCDSGRDVDELLQEAARTPLPPYITTPLQAGERYQTVYNATEGSSAAPTAGLHFTEELLKDAQARGVEVATITLHIGASTFRPVRTQNLNDHRISRERVRVSAEAAEKINSAAGRVIAVGTTSTRALEATATGKNRVSEFDGETDLFIKPGHEFRVVDGLITNFHMPRSTLLVLVATFAGRKLLLEAYEEAVRKRYRFLSLGDAMLIL